MTVAWLTGISGGEQVASHRSSGRGSAEAYEVGAAVPGRAVGVVGVVSGPGRPGTARALVMSAQPGIGAPWRGRFWIRTQAGTCRGPILVTRRRAAAR